MPAAYADADLLAEASQRLIRTVDQLDDAAWAEPSGLPGWTRAHVVAHLVLNAEGLSGALGGLVQGEAIPMYASQEGRDRDIEDLAQAEPTELRTRLLGATTDLADALAAIPEDVWSTRIERVPGGRTFAAASVPDMRLREVEIHHVDLGVGYGRADWSTGFAASVIDSMGHRDTGDSAFTVRATDLDRSWSLGSGTGPTVSGTSVDLAWWLTGRGTGDGLTSDDGELPGIGAW
ncbi:maleylpyruvate isomerase family mycothiol-dependent enzyme [Nocardioides sp. MAHUQ-72]|uniref:maleylpyruvate isomerase family mycothiol-dependent enzyme n=1 Tax=unclassified Nocardioides TaxID=2615069 RepID=UPI00361440B5